MQRSEMMATGDLSFAYGPAPLDANSLLNAFLVGSLFVIVNSLVIVAITIFFLNRFRPLASMPKQEQTDLKNPVTESHFQEKPQPDIHEICESLTRTYRLSQRESDILIQLAEGKTQQSIADSLFIAPGTLRAHTSHIYEKLSVHSHHELIEFLKDYAETFE